MNLKQEFETFKQNVFYLYTTTDEIGRRTRRGLLYGIAGIAILGGGAGLVASQQTASADTYQHIQVSYATAMAELKDAKKQGQDVTLILHRTGCTACESVETLVASRVNKLEKNNPNHRYITIDLVKLNAEQTKTLADMMPSVTIDGHIPSPAIVDLTLTSDNDRYIVSEQSVGAKPDTIKSVLD